MQAEWEDLDIVTILEDIRFSPPQFSTPLQELIRSNIEALNVSNDEGFSEANNSQANEASIEGNPIPVTINGSMTYSLERLRPSTTIQEVEMRIENDFQRFVTREGEDLFIHRDTLKRVDFKRISNSKRKQFTVNLPDSYQAKVNVNKAGKIVFHHHHRRGIEKIKSRILERNNRSTGGKC